METPQHVIRDQQQTVWNQFAAGWKKWDELTMQFLQPMGDAIIDALTLSPTDAVLDVATGTGEPGLTIAAKVTAGRVIGTDLSEGMLATAEEKARQRGLTNYRTQQADVCRLPFADASFDAVSCRMGFMFFPSMALAAQEMVRVLKPGGRLATSVWSGPADNPWVSTLMGIINQTLPGPPPPSDAPGMFRCAKPGLVSGFLTDAGLTKVQEWPLSGQVIHASLDAYWANMTEVAAPVVFALKQADPATIDRIKAELFARLRGEYGSGQLAIPFGTLIIQGIKESTP
ncbi:class I SAM-dependent methyltransferase [Spirosoma koreense]